MTIGKELPEWSPETYRAFHVYREALAKFGVAFFCYEGRGIRTDPKAPAGEIVDRKVYDTSSLENKARDALSAIAIVRKQPGCGTAKVLLLGVSEGSLLAAEAAARSPESVDGLVLTAVLASNLKESIKYGFTDGTLLLLLRQFDADGDGKITKAEYEADPKGYRKKTSLRSFEFGDLDSNGDGVLTVEDLRVYYKHYLDAVDKEDWAVLNEWVEGWKSTLPKDWFKDHFAHDPIWKFLGPLKMPVGIFHGREDSLCSVKDVEAVELLARKAGKKNIQFHYFPRHDHSFNAEEYISSGRPSKGHEAVIDYIRELSR
jgi:pimeloyl-ACP methyl ester carboxylesterase